MSKLQAILKILGGHIGQRERVLYTTWVLTFIWGGLRHLGYAADDSALTVLLTASGGVIASYTYRVSGVTAPVVTPETGDVPSDPSKA